MDVRNIQSLLAQYLNDGFTFECLSITTDVPVELINRCYNGENLSQEDCYLLNAVLYILTQLYFCDTTAKTYIGDISDVMCNLFKVSQSAIAKYLGLGDDMAEKYTVPKDVEAAQKHLPKTKSNYIDKEYQNTAISMMKKALEDFLAFREITNYKKGTQSI